MKNYLMLMMIVSVVFGGTLKASQELFQGDWNITFVGVGPTLGDTGWWSEDLTAARPTFADDVHTFNPDGSFTQNMQDLTWVEPWQDGETGEGSRTPAAPYDGSGSATWTYDAVAGTITVTGEGAYLGVPKAHNNGEMGSVDDPEPTSRTYVVTEISETQMTLDLQYPAGYWRSVLTNMDPSVALPVNFDINLASFSGYAIAAFGGATASIEAAPIANPDGSAATALKYVKGDTETWAGVELVLDSGLEDSDGAYFYANVYSSTARPITFKLDDANIEREVQHTGSGWEQLVFDFTGETFTNNTKIAFFNDLSQAGTSDPLWTIYIDDIEQAASIPNPIITDTNGTATTSDNQDFMLEYQATREEPYLETNRDSTNVQAGEWWSGESAILLYFPVPNFGAIADPFTNAELGVKLDNFGSADYDADLAYMGIVSDTSIPVDFYDRSNGTVIMDAFLTQSNESFGLAGLPGGPQIFTDSSANANLTALLNADYDSGNAVGSYYAFRIMASADPIAAGGNWSIRASEQAGEGPVLNWSRDGSALPFADSDAAANLASLRDGGLGTQKSIYFNIQKNPHPDTTPNFDTERVVISSTSEESFTVNIPVYEDATGTYPATQEFNNWILYIENAGGYALAINDLVLEIGGETWGSAGVQNSLIFEENFGGTRYVQLGDDHLYYFPTTGQGIQTWGGFALLGYDGLYPLVFENGATLTFKAKLVDPSIIPPPNEFVGEQAFSEGVIDFSPVTENPYKWSAYIEWFALTEDGEQGAREEGATQDEIQDLQVTTIFNANGDITLEPNSALYRPGSMWQGADGDGTKWVINSLRIEGDPGTSDLLGNDVNFSGTIAAFDIDPRYEVTANIKLLDANNNYQSVGFPATQVITEAGAFDLTLPMPDDGNYVPQLSFDIAGINANPDTDWGSMTVTNLVGTYGSLNLIENANFHYGDATTESNSVSYWGRSSAAEVLYVDNDGVGLRPGALRINNTANASRDGAYAQSDAIFSLADLEMSDASTIYSTYSMKRTSGDDLGLLELEFLDSSENSLGYAPDFATYDGLTATAEDGEWGEYTQSYTIPAGAAYVGLAFLGGAESDILFDSVKLSAETIASFEEWVSSYPALAGSTWESDTDGDGLKDGLEHVLGTDPTSATDSFITDYSVDGTETTFKHPVNDYSDPNASISYSWSTDLETWYDDGEANDAGISVVITDYVILGNASVRANLAASETALAADEDILDSVTKLFIKVNAVYTVPSVGDPEIVTVFSTSAGNLAGTDFNPNWGQATQVDAEGAEGLTYTGLNYQGTGYPAQDVSGHKYLHVEYKTSDAASLEFFVIKEGGGELGYDILAAGAADGEWHSVDIPLSHYSDAGVDLTAVNQFKVVGTGTVVFDNIRFQNTPGYMSSGSGDDSTPPAPFEAPSAAPAPAHAEADVATIYSTTYTNATGLVIDPNWGQATDLVETTNGLAYRNLNYQGTDYAAMDVSAHNTLHVSYYANNNVTALKITPISPGAELLVDLDSDGITTGAWTSVSIPLSSFPCDFTALNQLKVDGNGDVVLDHIYFYTSN